MTAPPDIAPLLQQWLRLTHEESEAIQALAWPTLRQIQAQKAPLRDLLDQALAKWKSGRPSGDSVFPWRAEITRLIALESRNAERVALHRQGVRKQQMHLDRAAQNLRKVRHSYAPPPAVTWNVCAG